MDAVAAERAGGALQGRLLVLLAGVFWSLGGVFVRLIEAATPWQIVFYRSLALAAFLLVVIAVRHRGAVVEVFRRAGRPAVVAGLCLSVGFNAFIFSLFLTTVANTLLILAAVPFLTAVGGLVVLGEPVRRATWAAIAVGVVGMAVMVGGADGANLLGSLAAFVAAVGFTGFTLALRHGRGNDMTPAVCLAGLFAALWSAGAVVVTGDGFAVAPRDMALAATMGVVQVGCGLTIYTVGSRRVPAAELGLLSLTEVVLGPLWVWLAVGEVPAANTVAGGAVLMAAIVGNAVTGMRRRPPPLGSV